MTTLSETEETAIKALIKKEMIENLSISIEDKDGWDYGCTYKTITVTLKYGEEELSSESISINTTKD